MQIILNGKKEIIEEGMKLLDFLLMKGLEPAKVVVEYNDEIVKRDKWENVSLEDNDKLEVLRFVGGG